MPRQRDHGQGRRCGAPLVAPEWFGVPAPARAVRTQGLPSPGSRPPVGATIGDVNHSELAAFLKSRRGRVRPSDVGLPTGPRRRVPGLRREEVAHLAGLSADYYTELERGRGAQPSAQVLAVLARALRLNGDERDHLFHLADRPIPPAAHGPTAHVQPGLLGLLDQLTTTPAQVITDLHETLVQNPLAAALVGGPRHCAVLRRASSTAGSPTPRPGPSTRPRTTPTTPGSSSPTSRRSPPAAAATPR